MSDINSMPVRESLMVKPSAPVVTDVGIVMHPFDVIWLNHKSDPHARLDALFAWITRWVAERATATCERIDRMGVDS